MKCQYIPKLTLEIRLIVIDLLYIWYSHTEMFGAGEIILWSIVNC